MERPHTPKLCGPDTQHPKRLPMDTAGFAGPTGVPELRSMIGGLLCRSGKRRVTGSATDRAQPRVFHEAGCPTDGQERSSSGPIRIRDLPNGSTGTVHLHNEAAPAVRSYLVEGASACQGHAVNESSTATRLSRALDWAGLIPSALLLAGGIRDYRDGGSVGWPVGGAALVLVSLWVIHRGSPRRSGRTTELP